MKTTDADSSIFCRSSSGHSFGADDIVLSENPSKNRISYSNMGETFAHDDYVKGSDEARSFLAGSFEIVKLKSIKKKTEET